jgi:hypothetical protein
MLGSVFVTGMDPALSAIRAVLCAPPVGGYSSPSTQCGKCTKRCGVVRTGFPLVGSVIRHDFRLPAAEILQDVMNYRRGGPVWCSRSSFGCNGTFSGRRSAIRNRMSVGPKHRPSVVALRGYGFSVDFGWLLRSVLSSTSTVLFSGSASIMPATSIASSTFGSCPGGTSTGSVNSKVPDVSTVQTA